MIDGSLKIQIILDSTEKNFKKDLDIPKKALHNTHPCRREGGSQAKRE